MKFELTILGCNAALPGGGRHPSAQVLNVHENLYLIDCGEGTQMRMNDFHIRKNKINHIFISHLHGDHIFGLIGLLTSWGLSNREAALHLFSPSGLEELLRTQLRLTRSHLSYPLHFHLVDTGAHQRIFESDSLEVYSLPLIHRIPTCGYHFVEKPLPLNIIREKIRTYDLSYAAIRRIKAGEDLHLPSGEIILNTELTLPPKLPRQYAYCSDTAFSPALVEWIRSVDLLYHEATFASDLEEQAGQTLHSTARQAARIAREAGVGQLLIGHFSSRYLDLNVLLEEARSVFKATRLAEEGRTFTLNHRRGQ